MPLKTIPTGTVGPVTISGRRRAARPASRFLRVIEDIEAPFVSGPAGMLQELLARRPGRKDVPMWDAYWEKGVKSRMTYGDVVGNAGLGLVMDVGLDPLTYTPLGAAARAVKLPAGFAKLAKIAEKVPGIRRTKLAVAPKFVRGYKERKIFGEAGEGIVNLEETKLAAQRAAIQKGEDFAERLTELLSDKNEIPKVFDIMERLPDGIKAGDVLPAGVAERVAKLSPEGQGGFRLALAQRLENEADKLAEGGLTKEVAGRIQSELGLSYMPHNALAETREYIARNRAGAIAGDKDALSIGTVKALTQALNAIDHLVDAPPTFSRETLERLTKMDFRRREIPGTAMEINAIMGDIFDTHLPRVLGAETAEVAKFVANKRWTDALAAHMKQTGIAVDSRMFRAGEKAVRGHYTAKFGKEAADDIMRGGMTTVEHPSFIQHPSKEAVQKFGPRPETAPPIPPGIGKPQYMMVPKVIADDLARVIKRSDPNGFDHFLKNYKKVQDVWKAWTLFHPAYHARNAVSEINLAFLDGMDALTDPKVIHDYWMAGRMISKKMRGISLGDADDKLLRKLYNDGLVGVGGRYGELAESFAKVAGRPWYLKQLLPGSSKPLQASFKVGRAVEDWTRLAHFLWRTRKGDDYTTAVARVRKWHYDFQLGLTPFEKKYFRDFAFPFYGWFRFNMPLQVEALVNKTGRSLAIPKLINAWHGMNAPVPWFGEDTLWGGPDEGERYFAEWLQRSLFLRARYDKKKDRYELFMFNNWLPMADLTQAMSTRDMGQAWLNLLTPLVKTPGELVANWDMYRHRQISEFPGQTRKMFKLDLPSRLTHFFRSLRPLNEADRIFMDIESGVPIKMRLFRLVGLKTYPVPMEKQRRWWGYETNRRISMAKKFRGMETRRPYPSQRQIERLDKLIDELTEVRDLNKR